jgi:hypothetical protein
MSEQRLRGILQELDRARQPDAQACQRQHQGVHDRLLARARRPRRIAAVVAAAAALAVALAVALGVLQGPAPIRASLVAETSGQAQLGDDVQVVFHGSGQATGEAKDITIHWEQGTLHTAVEPEQGVHLEVRTPEATVSVVGTVFDVARDPLGTAVSVSRGRVAVTCRGDEPVEIGAAEEHRCYRSAEAALQDALRSPTAEEALDILQRAAALEGAPAAHREVEAHMVEALRALGRDAEALAVARAYLDAGHPHRRVELLGVASELAFIEGGCELARPLLAELVAEDDAPVAALEQWARCGGEEP